MTETEKLIARIMEIDSLKGSLEDQVDELKQERARLEEIVLETLLSDHPDGQFSIKFNGRTAFLQRTLRAKYGPNGNRDSVTEALKRAGWTELVKEGFNFNSLSAVLREREGDGEPVIPPALEGFIEPLEKWEVRTRSAS